MYMLTHPPAHTHTHTHTLIHIHAYTHPHPHPHTNTPPTHTHTHSLCGMIRIRHSNAPVHNHHGLSLLLNKLCHAFHHVLHAGSIVIQSDEKQTHTCSSRVHSVLSYHTDTPEERERESKMVVNTYLASHPAVPNFFAYSKKKAFSSCKRKKKLGRLGTRLENTLSILYAMTNIWRFRFRVAVFYPGSIPKFLLQCVKKKAVTFSDLVLYCSSLVPRPLPSFCRSQYETLPLFEERAWD